MVMEPVDPVAALEAQVDALVLELKEARRQADEWRVLYETVTKGINRYSERFQNVDSEKANATDWEKRR